MAKHHLVTTYRLFGMQSLSTKTSSMNIINYFSGSEVQHSGIVIPHVILYSV